MVTNSPEPGNLKVPDGLFSDVKYYLIGNIDETVRFPVTLTTVRTPVE